MGDNDMNPESEVNTQGREYIPNTEIEIETDKEASTFEVSEIAIDQATENVKEENNQLMIIDRAKGLFKNTVDDLKFKAYELSHNVKEFFKSMTWSKAAKLGSTTALGFILVSCSAKSVKASAPIEPVEEVPAVEVLNSSEEKTEDIKEKVEESREAPEEEEISIPDVDLTWDWKDFEGYFRMTPTAEQMEESFKPEEGKSKYIIFGGAAGKMFKSDMTNLTSAEDLRDFDTIKKLNDAMKLGLDEQGEEILRQMFLYKVDWSQPHEDQNISMYVYVKDGCPYEKDGPLIIIWQDGTPQVVSEEDIPWDKIPRDVWDDIAAGNTRIDMSGDEVICSCNIHDIRTSSTEK